MKINIKATGIALTPAISDYTKKKVGTIGKYLSKDSPDIVASVEVGKSTRHHKSGDVFRAEVHIVGAGQDFYAVSEEADLYAAIDEVKDEVIRELKHEKGKRSALLRKGEQMMKYITKGYNWSLGKFRKGLKSDEDEV